MSRKVVQTLAAVVLFGIALGAGAEAAREILDVRIVNWPKTQNVRGTVEIDGPIQQAEQIRFEEVLVTPVSRGATGRLIEAGAVDADGFSKLSLSVVGEISGEALQPGELGVVLVPDTERILRAFREDGLFLFPLEVTAPIRGGQQIYLAGGPARFDLAFPQYRVFLYNTSDKAARVDLHLYASS